MVNNLYFFTKSDICIRMSYLRLEIIIQDMFMRREIRFDLFIKWHLRLTPFSQSGQRYGSRDGNGFRSWGARHAQCWWYTFVNNMAIHGQLRLANWSTTALSNLRVTARHRGLAPGPTVCKARGRTNGTDELSEEDSRTVAQPLAIFANSSTFAFKGGNTARMWIFIY